MIVDAETNRILDAVPPCRVEVAMHGILSPSQILAYVCKIPIAKLVSL